MRHDNHLYIISYNSSHLFTYIFSFFYFRKILSFWLWKQKQQHLMLVMMLLKLIIFFESSKPFFSHHHWICIIVIQKHEYKTTQPKFQLGAIRMLRNCWHSWHFLSWWSSNSHMVDHVVTLVGYYRYASVTQPEREFDCRLDIPKDAKLIKMTKIHLISSAPLIPPYLSKGTCSRVNYGYAVVTIPIFKTNLTSERPLKIE